MSKDARVRAGKSCSGLADPCLQASCLFASHVQISARLDSGRQLVGALNLVAPRANQVEAALPTSPITRAGLECHSSTEETCMSRPCTTPTMTLQRSTLPKQTCPPDCDTMPAPLPAARAYCC